MNFFKPEDFEYNSVNCGDRKIINIEYAANDANAKLEREAIKAWIHKNESGEILNITSVEGYRTELYAHKALLINIEPIEKCKHPAEKVRWQPGLLMTWNYYCECGATVRPKEFEVISE